MLWQEALLLAQLHYLMAQGLTKPEAVAQAVVTVQRQAEQELVLVVLLPVSHDD